MEVHHHPEIEKKSFKSYFLEFLMIFLAVTMGFFAETIREGITEDHRATVFAASMVKDLQSDSFQLASYRDYFVYTSINIDTFMLLLSAADPKNIPSGKLYWYGLFGGAHGYFIPNDATFQQMKNSGSLRMFSQSLETEVAKYDRFSRFLQSVELHTEGIYIELRKIRGQFFDFRYLDKANKIYQANRIKFDYSRVDSFLRSGPPLLNNDKILFNQYVELVRSRFLRLYNIAYADSLLRQGSLLIDDLQKQYNLPHD
jgi:hypothetical protein